MRAKARLDRLGLYPRPVRIDRVRVVVVPWFFRLPLFRRFDGYALCADDPAAKRADASDDLVTHELCHVWQMQHRPVHMPWSYLGTATARTPTRSRPAPPSPPLATREVCDSRATSMRQP